MLELLISAVVFPSDVDFSFKFSSSSDKISMVEDGNRERGHICNSFSSSWKSDVLVEKTGSVIVKLSNRLKWDDDISDCIETGSFVENGISFLLSIPCLCNFVSYIYHTYKIYQ